MLSIDSFASKYLYAFMVAETQLAHAPEAPSHSLATRLKVKNLYLIQNASHAEIAKQTKLTVFAVGKLISDSGWPALKKQAHALALKSSDADMSEAAREIVTAVTDQCSEIALSGLNRTREAVSSRGKDAAKNFQSWTAGVRNLVSAIKTLQAGGAADNGNTQINLFMIRAGDAMDSAKAVSQVTEIESKP